VEEHEWVALGVAIFGISDDAVVGKGEGLVE
jgi:hypothetical protein